MNQLAKLDFWNYGNYTAVDALIQGANCIDYITKNSGGNVSITGSPTSVFGISYGEGTATEKQGETLYNIGGNYRYASYRSPSGSTFRLAMTAQLLTNINTNYSGFEVHWNDTEARNDAYFIFIYNSVTYWFYWDTVGAVLRTSVSATNLLTLTGDTGATASISTSPTWKQKKIKVFVSGGNLYVKISAIEGVKNVLGYYSVASAASTFSGVTIPDTTQGFQWIDNVSIYGITSSQATTYAADIDGTPTNDMLPFQRYLPMLDIARVGGTGWTDTDDVEDPDLAYGDLVDGNLTTFATTATTNPIGLDGTASLGTLLGNGYYWTPGSLTALPTIGIIRSLQNSKYQLASTEAETVRTKFGDGTDSIKFDTATGAVESGETIVNTVFSDNGTFSDGVDSVVIDTATTLRSTIELTA